MNISEVIDTISVCRRNPISDITFCDSDNFVSGIDQPGINGFPFIFIEKNKIRESEAKESLLLHLKAGKELPVRLLHDDWIILLILAAAFIYSSARTFSKRLFPEVIRFFLFRGIGDPSSREISELFHWQSTIINLISFFNLAIFAYCAFSYYNFVPQVFPGIVLWLIAFGIIVVTVTFQHIVCFITGSLSGKEEIFNEYLLTVYQAFRYMAILLYIIVILITYTRLFNPKSMILVGLILIAIIYSMRIIRLFLIFIKRKISILYLILYLCALEFLPVMVVLKYFMGVF
jgi:hypothetical protein